MPSVRTILTNPAAAAFTLSESAFDRLLGLKMESRLCPVAAEVPTVNYHFKEAGYLVKGATGSPACTLVQLALNLANGSAVS